MTELKSIYALDIREGFVTREVSTTFALDFPQTTDGIRAVLATLDKGATEIRGTLHAMLAARGENP
jgi:hypothetical protein